MSKPSYPQYERENGWNALLPGRSDVRVLQADKRCDLAIIGAGYTGIAAARRWAELLPDDEIVILDSSEIGEGSPGRNSGFLLEVALANDADPRQMPRMAQCNRLIGEAMASIENLVRDGAIDCDLERAGTYRAAAGGRGSSALRQYVEFLQLADLPYELLDRPALQDRLGTGYYSEGIYSPHCYLVQPAALIRGLARLLPSSISVYENSPATGVEKTGAGWRIRTPGGDLTTRKVVLANNAFSRTFGVGGSQLVAIYTYAGITEVLPDDLLDSLGSERSWGLLPAHRLGSTLRRTRDGRLLIRSQYGYEREADNSVIEKRLLHLLRKRFPQLLKARLASVWGGATGLTLNGAPLWGEARPGMWVSSGCNGGGVVKGTLFGKLLAEFANGLDVPDVRNLFGAAGWMPPEPLRKIGFQVISGIEKFQGRAEI
jgi:glycine/D-amino acid oxidase-like deaminating enzyme